MNILINSELKIVPILEGDMNGSLVDYCLDPDPYLALTVDVVPIEEAPSLSLKYNHWIYVRKKWICFNHDETAFSVFRSYHILT